VKDRLALAQYGQHLMHVDGHEAYSRIRRQRRRLRQRSGMTPEHVRHVSAQYSRRWPFGRWFSGPVERLA
jgi:hypothetical protein